jgi:hypothetical protein
MYFSINTILAIGFIIAFVLPFLKIDWAICLFIFLSPFHYLFKEIAPSIVTDLWREIFVLCILWSWLIQVLSRKLPLPPRSLLTSLVVTYLLWGTIEIFHSVNLLVGLAGFRFMFAFVPLYFVALSTIKNQDQIWKYVNAVLLSGFIVAAVAIIALLFVSVTGAAMPGVLADLAGKYGGAIRIGVSLQRSSSILVNPNELGNFLFVCLVFGVVSVFHGNQHRMKRRKTLVFSVVIMLVALLLSMSRSSIIALLCALLAASLLVKAKTRTKLIIPVVVGMAIIVFVLPFSLKDLFGSVYTFSDPYFEGLKSEQFWSAVWQSPLLGHGFSATPSAAEKLGIAYLGVTGVGSTDNYFLQTASQIGVIGFLLHFLICLCFLRSSYIGATSAVVPESYKSVSIALFGIWIGLLVASLHTAPWEYASLSGIYVFGAIATFIHWQSSKALACAARQEP